MLGNKSVHTTLYLPDILQLLGIGAQPRWCYSLMGSGVGGGIIAANI